MNRITFLHAFKGLLLNSVKLELFKVFRET